MTTLIFELALCALMLLLGATPLFRGNRRQKQYEKEGMRIISYPHRTNCAASGDGLSVYRDGSIFHVLLVAG